MAEGMQHCAEILFAGGASRVLVPYSSPLVLEPERLARRLHRARRAARATSRSPRRTRRAPARWARIRRRAVVNSYCQSHDVPNLFVCDMGVFPTSLGAPPQISTAAIADRTAHYIAANWASISKG